MTTEDHDVAGGTFQLAVIVGVALPLRKFTVEHVARGASVRIYFRQVIGAVMRLGNDL